MTSVMLTTESMVTIQHIVTLRYHTDNKGHIPQLAALLHNSLIPLGSTTETLRIQDLNQGAILGVKSLIPKGILGSHNWTRGVP